jgi:hypothetical protein
MFLLILVLPGLKSQNLFVDAAGERIQVFTDRTLYISGEKVHFSALIFSGKDHNSINFSRVLYCELITPDGNKIAGAKYLLQNSSGQGCFKIPEETISGIYYLKLYTRFMRNAGTDEYKFIMLKIINPLKTEVLSGKDVFDTAGFATNKRNVFAGNLSMMIKSGKKTFAPREEIRLIVNGDTGKSSPSGLCLSVIPESSFQDSFFPVKHPPDDANNSLYFPETRGISLSGKLIGKESGKPVANAKINLSIIGDKDIMVVLTDSAGRFFFALPDYHSSLDIFLCADDLPDVKPEILIDNDFCSRPVSLSSPVFALSEVEMKIAYKLAVNFRITSLFRADSLSADSLAEEHKISFYGKPSEILVMDKYIDLPSIGEYFTELPGLGKLRKVNGKKQFRFYTDQDEMLLYDPLLLVDWVAVNDIEKILGMSPREIERIELINSLYVKGNNTYGGIICFVSKKNDFAGIDLPSSGTFVHYQFLEECTENIPLVPASAHLPDSRNTVYWNPAVHTDDNGTAGISFTTPDTPGRYSILLRGITPTGEVVLTEEKIVVTAE